MAFQIQTMRLQDWVLWNRKHQPTQAGQCSERPVRKRHETIMCEAELLQSREACERRGHFCETIVVQGEATQPAQTAHVRWTPVPFLVRHRLRQNIHSRTAVQN